MNGLRIGGLFEGYGGLTIAVRQVLGGDLAWYSEIEPAACRVLAHHHPDVPNLGDITVVDWAAAEPVDVLTGGFPCQDVSSAGRRAGIRPGTRTGLWAHMAYAIDQLRPRLVVIENVRGLLSADAACDLEPCLWCLGDDEGRPLRALGAVLGDLADLGYDARWVGLRAADVGAPHGRFRVFIAAAPVADDHDGGRAAELLTGGAGPEHDRFGGDRGAAADADGVGQVRAGGARRGRGGPADDDRAPADADRDRRAGGRASGPGAEDARRDGPRAAPAGRGADAAPDPSGAGAVAWGDYEPAIRRWEHLMGRPAPAPTVVGRHGGRQLSPVFVEWMQGLQSGHVTAVPGLSRNEQLKLLGNGVVPQQGAAALRELLARVAAESLGGAA